MMKKLLLMLLAITMLGLGANAQQEKKTESKNELFLKRHGSLITRTSYAVGDLKGVYFTVVQAKDELTGEKITFLQIKTESYSSGSSTSHIAAFDDDEVKAAIKALTYMRDYLLPIVPENSTESIFSTRGKGQIGAFVSEGKWKLFIQPESYTYRAMKFLKAEEMNDLISKLTESSLKIEELSKP